MTIVININTRLNMVDFVILPKKLTSAKLGSQVVAENEIAGFLIFYSFKNYLKTHVLND